MASVAELKARAKALYEAEKFAEGLEVCRELMAAEPEVALHVVKAANCLQHLGRHTEALQLCDQAVTLNANEADAFAVRGISLGKLGRHEDAIGSLTQALDLDPSRMDIKHLRACAFCARGLQELALYREATRAGEPEARARQAHSASEAFRAALLDYTMVHIHGTDCSGMLSLLREEVEALESGTHAGNQEEESARALEKLLNRV